VKHVVAPIYIFVHVHHLHVYAARQKIRPKMQVEIQTRIAQNIKM